MLAGMNANDLKRRMSNCGFILDGACLCCLSQSMVLEGHLGAVKCVAYSPDGKTLASTGIVISIAFCKINFNDCTNSSAFLGSDGTLKIWQMSSKMCSSTVRSSIVHV